MTDDLIATLKQIHADLVMALHLLRESGADPEAWIDSALQTTAAALEAAASLREPPQAPWEPMAEAVEEFIGWWSLNREGSVNRTYDYIDKLAKRLRAALPPLPLPSPPASAPAHDKSCISLSTALPCDCELAPHRQVAAAPAPKEED